MNILETIVLHFPSDIYWVYCVNLNTWWQFYSTLVYLIKYQISKVCLVLMYKKHTHMVYGWFRILPYLVFYQNSNYNAYSNLLRHEVWNVDYKIIIMEIDLCYNKFSRIWVPQQHYPKHNTLFLSILLPWILFYIFLDQ